jgi:hypothetical protein
MLVGHLGQRDEASVCQRCDNKPLLATNELILVDEVDISDADHGLFFIGLEVKPVKG